MKKLLLALVLLVGGAAVFGYMRLGWLVKTAVESYGPKLTKTSVTLRRVTLSPFDGEGRLVGLEIGSPAGFKEPYVLRVESVRVKVEPKSLLTDHIVVREVAIDGPELRYERTLSGSNLDALQRNVAAFSPADEPKPAGKPAKEKKISIDRLSAKDGKAVLNLLGAKAEVPLPAVELKDLGKGGGASPQQVAQKVLGALTQAAVAAAGNVKGTAQDLTKAVGGVLKGLFGK